MDPRTLDSIRLGNSTSTYPNMDRLYNCGCHVSESGLLHFLCQYHDGYDTALDVHGGEQMMPSSWKPKMLREQLCEQQTFAPDTFTRDEIGRLIAILDLHRPLRADGKHRELHTPTCGCEDHL